MRSEPATPGTQLRGKAIAVETDRSRGLPHGPRHLSGARVRFHPPLRLRRRNSCENRRGGSGPRDGGVRAKHRGRSPAPGCRKGRSSLTDLSVGAPGFGVEALCAETLCTRQRAKHRGRSPAPGCRKGRPSLTGLSVGAPGFEPGAPTTALSVLTEGSLTYAVTPPKVIRSGSSIVERVIAATEVDKKLPSPSWGRSDWSLVSSYLTRSPWTNVSSRT